MRSPILIIAAVMRVPDAVFQGTLAGPLGPIADSTASKVLAAEAAVVGGLRHGQRAEVRSVGVHHP